MSSPFIVSDGWKIDHWTPDADVLPDGIPSDGFQQGGPLDITFEMILGAGSFSLEWLNQRGQRCSVSGLQSNEEQTELQGRNLSAQFGDRSVPCDVTVTLTQATHPKKLRCTITLPRIPTKGVEVDGPDTGGGTFTATANAGGNNSTA